MRLVFSPSVMLSKGYFWADSIDYSLYRYDRYAERYDCTQIKRKV